jgi:Glycosyltransferases, probably involved in cell wall biogenesis
LEKEKDMNIDTRRQGVSIIVCTNRPNSINNIFDNYERQRYIDKELIVVLNNNSMSLKNYKEKSLTYPNIKIYQLDESCALGKCLNFGIQKAKYEYIAKMDDDDYYAPKYLIDSINKFQYTDADIVGKLSYFVYIEKNGILAVFSPNNENKYTDFVAGATLVVKRKVFNKVKFEEIIDAGEDTEFLIKCKEENYKIYSGDKYNYVYKKHEDINNHTWKITAKDYLQSCSIKYRTYNYIPFITR